MTDEDVFWSCRMMGPDKLYCITHDCSPFEPCCETLCPHCPRGVDDE